MEDNTLVSVIVSNNYDSVSYNECKSTIYDNFIINIITCICYRTAIIYQTKFDISQLYPIRIGYSYIISGG